MTHVYHVALQCCHESPDDHDPYGDGRHHVSDDSKDDSTERAVDQAVNDAKHNEHPGTGEIQSVYLAEIVR